MITIKTPECILCNQGGEVLLTKDQEERYLSWSTGIGAMQEMLPDVPAPVREQLLTGTHPACWDAMFEDPEDS